MTRERRFPRTIRRVFGGFVLAGMAGISSAGAELVKPAEVVAIGAKAAAIPPPAARNGLYEDEKNVRRAGSVAGLIPERAWKEIPEIVEAGKEAGNDVGGLVNRHSRGYWREVETFPGILHGAKVVDVPKGYRQLLYERIEAKRTATCTIRVLTPAAASVYLNGNKVWEQKSADLLDAPKSIELRLKAGVNHLFVEADATTGLSFLTTGAAQRVGSFLAPLLAANAVTFAWFEPWLENPVAKSGADPLDECLRAVGGAALSELRRRGGTDEAVLKRGEQVLASNASLPEKARLVLEAAAHRRNLRLAEIRTQAPSVVYSKHQDYRPSFIGYTEGLSDARAERHFHPGTSLELLDFTDSEPAKRELIRDNFGMIRDPDVSYDGKSILFAWKKSDRNDDFQLHEFDVATGKTRQLTFGLGTANYEGAYLPDNTIVFSSTRNEHSVPCWLTEVSNLYKMNRDGSFLRRLAIDQVHSIYPKPTDDGRITYTRWDYSDRGQVFPHPVFQMNQDGTMQGELYGASSWFPNSLLHTRQIPGTKRFLAVAAGHHTPQAGKVVELDVDRGRDEGEGVRFVGPVAEVKYERVDSAMQHGAQFSHPFPLSERTFITAHLPVGRALRRFDLYWFDFDGGRELLIPGSGFRSSLYPVALAPRERAHVRPERVDYANNDSIIFIEDVYKGSGLAGIPRGTADRLRVVEVRYRSATVGGTDNSGPGGGAFNGTPIAVGQGSWDVKAIIGETPIHPDGSVLVKVPAMKSIYYQILDKQGQVIQTMRTWDTNRQGEIKSCVGCHSYDRNDAPTAPQSIAMAMKSPPAELQPFEPTGWDGFSFPKHVQPILTRSCVDCHNGASSARVDLRGDVFESDPVAKRKWSRAYVELTAAEKKENGLFSGRPDGPFVKWINKMSEPTALPPRSAGSSKSPLIKMLRDGHHGVKLSEQEFATLSAWIDLVVPFAGDYHEGADWDDEARAFYKYYEDKRRLSKAREHDEIARYLEGTQASEWFAPELTPIDVVLERDGRPLLSKRFEPRDLVTDVDLKLPGPLRPGDRLSISGARDLRVGLGGLPEAEIFAPDRKFTWTVEPGLEAVLPKDLFTKADVELRVKVLRAEERGAYRNLARNPLAPFVGKTSFPHVAASSETREDPAFRARAAIDGFEENLGHGGFPNQSWGPEKADRPWLAVKFGRKVRIDRVDLLLRADFPHDESWRHAVLVADGRQVASFNLRHSAEVQTVRFDPVECETLELRELEWTKPGWCALSEIRVWGLDADRTPRALIAEKSADGKLEDVPLQ